MEEARVRMLADAVGTDLELADPVRIRSRRSRAPCLRVVRERTVPDLAVDSSHPARLTEAGVILVRHVCAVVARLMVDALTKRGRGAARRPRRGAPAG